MECSQRSRSFATPQFCSFATSPDFRWLFAAWRGQAQRSAAASCVSEGVY